MPFNKFIVLLHLQKKKNINIKMEQSLPEVYPLVNVKKLLQPPPCKTQPDVFYLKSCLLEMLDQSYNILTLHYKQRTKYKLKFIYKN